MSKKVHAAWSMLIVAVALLMSGCDDGAVRGMLIFDGRHVISHNQTVPGHLAVLAGDVTIESGAVVEGSAWLVGGALTIAGDVEGDVTGLAGKLTISESARIGGKVAPGGSLASISSDAEIVGTVEPSPAKSGKRRLAFADRLVVALQIAVLVALLSLAFGFSRPHVIARVGLAAFEHPAVSLASGILAGVTGLVLLVLVAFTLILLPVVLLLGLIGLFAIAFGWVGMGAWLAQRLCSPRAPTPFMTALCSFVFVTVIHLLPVVPVVGSILGPAVTLWGLGAVLITFFGSRTFRPAVIPEPIEAYLEK